VTNLTTKEEEKKKEFEDKTNAIREESKKTEDKMQEIHQKLDEDLQD
jgi:hypothetical protein